MSDLEKLALRARDAAAGLATITTEVKNRALLAMADELERGAGGIIEDNERDLQAGREQGLSTAIIDRLTLNEHRVKGMADGLRQVAALRDPVGEITDGWRLPNGLIIEKVRVPIGVIGIIYEARPNVTVDAAGLCVKSGNAVVLRGSSGALNSNMALVRILENAGSGSGLPDGSIQLVEEADRETALELMRLHGLIDVLIPRGGEGLIRTVIENSTVPVIETGVGNCHVYVHADADIGMAADIVINAKTQRPGVCNAAETLLVHRDAAPEFLPYVKSRLDDAGVTIRADEKARQFMPEAELATDKDWSTEYLDLMLAVRVVESLDEAIAHINKYGSGHSDAIVTSGYDSGKQFVEEVDSAVVYVNASTRFTDGGEFGMGAEIGISTQKLHARGPMSLTELTTNKYVVHGSGQIRS